MCMCVSVLFYFPITSSIVHYNSSFRTQMRFHLQCVQEKKLLDIIYDRLEIKNEFNYSQVSRATNKYSIT